MKRLLATMLFAAAVLGVSEVSHAGLISYQALLSGPAEVPPNASPGTGFAMVEVDAAAHTLRVIVTFSDLIGTTTASHIHCCTATPGASTAGVATQTPTFSDFPLGVTAGSYDKTFDTSLASTWNTPFITANGGTALGAEAALLAGLAAGKAYLNIHTSAFGGGEIRGFLAVPEPATAALIGVALVGLALALRRRPKSS